MSLHGDYFVFEGLDGSGQTTQVKLLQEYLENEDQRVHTTKEPTNNIVGGLVRGFLTHEWDIPEEGKQLLFAADRAHLLDREVKPMLEKGFTVVSDRSMYSSMAYGGIELPIEYIEDMNSRFLKPDVVFYLRVPAEECVRRMDASRNEKEFYEKVDTLEKVLANYDKLAEKYNNIITIDGTKSIEKVHRNVVDALNLFYENQ